MPAVRAGPLKAWAIGRTGGIAHLLIGCDGRAEPCLTSGGEAGTRRVISRDVALPHVRRQSRGASREFTCVRGSGFAARCEAGLCPAGNLLFNGGLCPRFGLGPLKAWAIGRAGGIAHLL